MHDTVKLTIINIFVRLCSVYFIQTYYVPDEFWQSLEVAHKLVFGNGYLTWEWEHGLRSYLYPAIIAAIYKLLDICRLDSVQLMIFLPRIMQAALSCYSDYRFYIWSGKKKWAWFMLLTSWFWVYISTRTLINTVEVSLTTIALSYFPWKSERYGYMWCMMLCCFLRPTAITFWFPLLLCHFIRTHNSTKFITHFLKAGIVVVAFCIAVDSYFYGRFIITPYNFINFNVLQNVGAFYGSHSTLWYLINGLPVVLGINTIFFLWGAYDALRGRWDTFIQKILLLSITFTLFMLSLVEHKEYRFVAILLPACIYIASQRLSKFSVTASNFALIFIGAVLFIGNLLPIIFVSLYQRGPIDLMPKLQQIAQDYREGDGKDGRASILFLMPCHSTPYYSHVHENITMRFITCLPNLSNDPLYRDESDIFYDNPTKWEILNTPYFPHLSKASHIVFYDSLRPKIDFVISGDYSRGYKYLDSVDNSFPIKYLKSWLNLLNIDLDKLIPPEITKALLPTRISEKILIYKRSTRMSDYQGDEEEEDHQ